MKKNTTKHALLLSILSIMLCAAMLIGTTYAWFTDSVTSGKNKIVAGNLDIELKYSKDFNNWKTVQGATDLVDPNALWEPGHTEVVYLEISNIGSLALKYNFDISVVNSTVGISVLGNEIKLSDYLMYDVIEVTEAFEDRDEAREAVEDTAKKLDNYNGDDVTMASDEQAKTFALVVYMPEEVGNVANYRTDAITMSNGVATGIPSIELGVSVVATQLNHESETDSFNENYDKDAPLPVIVGDDGAKFDLSSFNFNIPQDAIDDNADTIIPLINDLTPTPEVILPEDITGTLKHKLKFDIELEGIKEGNTEPIEVKYVIPGNEDYVGVEVYHNGVLIPDATYDPATRTVSFEATSFSPYEFVLDVGATVIPESYTNDEAIAMLKAAKDGAIIDGNGRKITLPDNVANNWSFLVQNGVTFRNMTLSAKGDGTTVMFYCKNKTAKMKNVTFENTKYGKKAVEISTNARKSLVFEDCTIKGKAYVQGPNITFTRCSFNTNMNLESASNITFNDNVFTVSGAITMNSTLSNILFVNNTFKYANAIRLYAGMPQPTNVQLIGNTYKTTLVKPDSGVDYAGWKTAGAWIEQDNTQN